MEREGTPLVPPSFVREIGCTVTFPEWILLLYPLTSHRFLPTSVTGSHQTHLPRVVTPTAELAATRKEGSLRRVSNRRVPRALSFQLQELFKYSARTHHSTQEHSPAPTHLFIYFYVVDSHVKGTERAKASSLRSVSPDVSMWVSQHHPHRLSRTGWSSRAGPQACCPDCFLSRLPASSALFPQPQT